MSYTINYTGSKAENMAKALNDAIDYMGVERFDLIMDMFKNVCELNGIRNLAITYAYYTGMVGLRGAPARAMALHAIRKFKGTQS